MYKTKNGWTKEQMKSAIWAGNNGKVSKSGWGQNMLCRYRTLDGNRCAVGVFIPDDLYDEKRCEKKNAYKLFTSYPGLCSYMPLSTEGMAMLQQQHDDLSAYCGVEDVRSWLCAWIDDHVSS